jgi:hypothetical protein
MQRYDPLKAPHPQQWLALDEQERIQLVEDFHRRAGIRLPNDKAHAIFHAIVENQVACGDETPVRRTLERLMSEGLDRHDAIHAVGLVLSDLIYDTNAQAPEENADPNSAYFAAIERLTAEAWRRRSEEPIEDEPEITRILDQLDSWDNGVPVEAIRAAQAQKAVVVPAFLRAIERSIEGAHEPRTGALFLIFHLLGEWREKSAYRLLARLLRRPREDLDEILGDAITITSHRIMAAVFDGDPQPIYDVILDPAADEFVRARMCEALAMVTLQGELPREETARFLRACHHDLQPQSDSFVWDGWQSAIALLGLVELKPLVERAFRRGYIDPGNMSFEHFEEDLKRSIDHPGEPRWPSDDEFALFGDTIEELSTWASFAPDGDHDDELDSGIGAMRSTTSVPTVNPFKRVGRNDPCPCGSGKKFKKCCLNQAAV